MNRDFWIPRYCFQDFPSLSDHFQSTVFLQIEYRQLDTRFSLQLRGVTDSFRVSCHGFVCKGFTWLTEHSGAQKDLGLWERCFSLSDPWRNLGSACLLISKHPMHASPVFLLIPQIHVCHLENCTAAEDITPLYMTSPRKVIADPYNG